jgi:hypothetical protein
MKKFILPLLLFVSTGSLFAQANKRVTIKNSSGYDFVNLFASAGSEEWNDIDQLGDVILRNEEQTTIQVNTVTDCEWDFKAVDLDDDVYVKHQDVCENATVEFTMEDILIEEDNMTGDEGVTTGGDEEAEADEPIMEEDMESVFVTFKNKTGTNILIIKWIIDGMQEEMDFSGDILGEENILEVNEEEEVSFSVPSGTCDLIFIFETEDETKYRKEVNVCPIGETVNITRADKLDM